VTSATSGQTWLTEDVTVSLVNLKLGLPGHIFYVRAVNSRGYSSPSGRVGPIVVQTLPLPPALGAVTGGDGTVSIYFSPRDDGGSAIQYFLITNVQTHNVTRVDAATHRVDVPYVIKGLQDGTGYQFALTVRHMTSKRRWI
jgi:hypothetical protein